MQVTIYKFRIYAAIFRMAYCFHLKITGKSFLNYEEILCSQVVFQLKREPSMFMKYLPCDLSKYVTITVCLHQIQSPLGRKRRISPQPQCPLVIVQQDGVLFSKYWDQGDKSTGSELNLVQSTLTQFLREHNHAIDWWLSHNQTVKLIIVSFAQLILNHGSIFFLCPRIMQEGTLLPTQLLNSSVPLSLCPCLLSTEQS